MTSQTVRTSVSTSVALVLCACAAVTAPSARADANADPSYEVKLDLGSSALGSDGKPTAAVLSTFGLSSPTQRSYEYLDTNPLELNGEGWDVRLRHKAGKDLELSYKKRFPVTNGDVDAALDDANDAGFDSSDTNYDAEVDWGYSKQTLSFSNEKTSSASGLSGTSLPSSSTAVSLATSNVPGKLEDWRSGSLGNNWGKDRLAASRVHGPVTSTVWSGSWHGADASLEVVTVRAASGSGTETVAELSFKTGGHSSAATVRNDAISTTDSRGWLLHTDVLKTQLVLTRY